MIPSSSAFRESDDRSLLAQRRIDELLKRIANDVHEMNGILRSTAVSDRLQRATRVWRDSRSF